jgi:hypothetical protein
MAQLNFGGGSPRLKVPPTLDVAAERAVRVAGDVIRRQQRERVPFVRIDSAEYAGRTHLLPPSHGCHRLLITAG